MWLSNLSKKLRLSPSLSLKKRRQRARSKSLSVESKNDSREPSPQVPDRLSVSSNQQIFPSGDTTRDENLNVVPGNQLVASGSQLVVPNDTLVVPGNQPATLTDQLSQSLDRNFYQNSYHDTSMMSDDSELEMSIQPDSVKKLTRSVPSSLPSYLTMSLGNKGHASLPTTPNTSPAIKRARSIKASTLSLNDDLDFEELSDQGHPRRHNKHVKVKPNGSFRGLVLRGKKGIAEFDESIVLERSDFDLDYGIFPDDLVVDIEFEVNHIFFINQKR
jgi:hypothetical protein